MKQVRFQVSGEKRAGCTKLPMLGEQNDKERMLNEARVLAEKRTFALHKTIPILSFLLRHQ